MRRPQATLFHCFQKALRPFQSRFKSPSKNFTVLSENFNLFPGIRTYQWVAGKWDGENNDSAVDRPRLSPPACSSSFGSGGLLSARSFSIDRHAALACPIVVSPDTVRSGVEALVAETGADELMIVSDVLLPLGPAALRLTHCRGRGDRRRRAIGSRSFRSWQQRRCTCRRAPGRPSRRQRLAGPWPGIAPQSRRR